MRLFLLSLSFAFGAALFAQSPATKLLGAWESTFTDAQGRSSALTMTIADGFMVMTAYNKESGEFIATLGGRWRADWDNFSITYEFDSSDSTQVGGVSTMPYSLVGSVLVFNGDKVWTRTDDMSPGALPGAWEIIGRKRNGKMQDLSERRTSPRKTMKILSGSRFQWIAFDIAKKKFTATGGGSYTTDENGMYIEKIEFFSRDPERAGSQLSFDFKLQNGDWVHRGVSSKGEPLHEVWSLRQ
ncbi:membrane or secreted protein [Neolewinella aurantiaca]|uniref:Membrane or secreted protein n=1 Tax=Neolewinella aurantiaca TaxID=2602767 RepID=A0A5C7FKR8_9BACT|nr:membrane or secreted protein [Neolewinella aurantiaca]TXF91283.1 membrane or secreted protein [Neolewinella aurantiaca]